MLKTCTRCKCTKAISEFSISKRRENRPLKEGSTFKRSSQSNPPEIEYHSYCKECNSAYAREFRKRYKEETGNTDYRGSGKNKKYPKEDRKLISAIRSRITSTKHNCRNSDIKYNLSEEYLYNLFKKQEGKCALTGFTIAIDGNTNLRLSLDKIIPANGYVEGNVQWTIFSANRAKGDLSYEDFIKLCSLVLERATTIESTLIKGSK